MKNAKNEDKLQVLLTIGLSMEEKKRVKSLAVDLNIGLRDILLAGLKTLTPTNQK